MLMVEQKMIKFNDNNCGLIIIFENKDHTAIPFFFDYGIVPEKC